MVESFRQAEARMRAHWESKFGPLSPAEVLESEKAIARMEQEITDLRATHADQLTELALCKTILKKFTDRSNKHEDTRGNHDNDQGNRD